MTLHASASLLAFYLIEWFILQIIRLFRGPTPKTEESVQGKVVVITGANSGLGKYTAGEFAKRGAKVVLACRNMTEAQKAMDEIKSECGSDCFVDVMELDLSDMKSIRLCADLLKAKYLTIDILVNNAGISLNCPERKFTSDGFEVHMGTNHLGHFLLTNLLLTNIKRSMDGRIITVSSTAAVMSNLEVDNLMMADMGLGLGNTMPYNNSKFANALFSKELGKRLEGTKVKTYAVCPGLARSNIFQHYSSGVKMLIDLGSALFFLPVDKAADVILYCALAKELSSSSGKMYRFGRKFTSIEPLLKDQLAKDLFDISERLVGLG